METDGSQVPDGGPGQANEAAELESYLEESRLRKAHKIESRQQNIHANTNMPEESFFSKLDSSLKKNTAFIKKLRMLTESQRDSLLKEFAGLNLSKYVAEMCAAIVEAKLKMSDVSTAVDICSVAHRRYADFASTLLDSFKKILPRKKDDSLTNPSKLRVDLRLFSELISVAVIPEKEGLQLLGACLMFLTSTDKEEHSNIAILASFCKFCGEDYLGRRPRRVTEMSRRLNRSLDGQPLDSFISAERQANVYKLFADYYNSLCVHVTRLHREMMRLEKLNYKLLHTRGEVGNDQKQALEDAKAAFEKLYNHSLTFSDLIDSAPLDFPKQSLEDEIERAEKEATAGEGDAEISQNLGPWEDDDTRVFYEDLPELKAMLPGILFKDSEKPTLPALEEKMAELTTEEHDEDLASVAVELEAPVDAIPNLEEESVTTDSKLEEEISPDKATGSTDITGSTLKLMMETFSKNLPNLVNRTLIDAAAVDFVTNLNTSINRKKLVKTLFSVPRTRLDLLPFYARFVAVLNPVMPDTGTELVHMLIQDFRYHLRKKDQVFVESKVKVVKFLGELVKFKICPKSEILHCLKMLLFDFHHHNIDMACGLLDVCGYCLFHCSDSHIKTRILLETMMRKKQASHLNQKYELMIDNTYSQCNPPVVAPQARVERPPMHEYICHTIFRVLSKHTVEKVLKQVRKLDWEDPVIYELVVRCLSSPWEVRYSCIQCLASLLAGLTWYYEDVGCKVIDAVLENIRLCLEINHVKLNQRRICLMKFLGELYNYRCVDSGVIFNVLYSHVAYGSSRDPKQANFIDPPDQVIRLRLMCALLDTCGSYFDRGSSKKKLDCFLTYLQRYYWQKRSAPVWRDDFPFPVEMDNIVTEIMEKLRPRAKRFSNLAEAEKAVLQIEDEYRAKVESVLQFVQTDGDAGVDFNEERDLEAINEEDELKQTASNEMSASQDSTGLGQEGATFSSDEDERVCIDDDDDDVKVRLLPNAGEPVPEEDDFMSALDKMVSDSFTQRLQETIKIQQTDFCVPTTSKLKARAHFEDEDSDASDETKEDAVNFAVMLKGKANKPILKAFKVPVNSPLAQAVRTQEEAELREKERVKKLTLDITQRMEDEERSAGSSE